MSLIDPLLRAWGDHPPAIIRDMQTTAAGVGLTDLLQDAVAALDTCDDLACRVALVAALGLLGEHAHTHTPASIEYDCNRLQLTPAPTVEYPQTPVNTEVNSTVDT